MKTLPERIIVLRGGVSDGQFKHVLTSRASGDQGLVSLFQELQSQAHHRDLREAAPYALLPDKAQAGGQDLKQEGRDRGVTAVYNFDFFLQAHAHAGQQGAVRTTHYTVIFDENRFSADEIQQGAHDASYLWSPATKSVRLVPPAYAVERRAGAPGCISTRSSPLLRPARRDEAQIMRRAKEL
ncbi:hypothetical protein DFH11DRAFT_1742326 [Phellopilus nigrolimitatus]|nr:hypothetical protein DFH11DRAFT_1039843 [Phellopilus nigrolimitatus]KAH8115887.1 hypothetical protein DFH11DRAFT_1742326 [Phellopilus nigrolimitatus]